MNNQMNKTDVQFRNFAFISYSRRDIGFASWFQKNLETYHLPSKLVKAHSELPKSLSPIFRDQTDLAGVVLEEALMHALDESRYLIVICSPNSAKSRYVNSEIE